MTYTYHTYIFFSEYEFENATNQSDFVGFWYFFAISVLCFFQLMQLTHIQHDKKFVELFFA